METAKNQKYSGDIRRRINLGCALLHRPRLLLLDEPAVGGDPQARTNIQEFIHGLTADPTYRGGRLLERGQSWRKRGLVEN